MDFRTLIEGKRLDKAYTKRQRDIMAWLSVLDGELYDHLQHPFHAERNGAGEYVKLRDRRPSARSNIVRITVRDSVSLLFGDGHFPSVDVAGDGDSEGRNALRDALAEVARAGLQAAMGDAARIGSAGSAAVLMQIMQGRVFWSAMRTSYLTPVWRDDVPDELKLVHEAYKVLGSDLEAAGYSVSPADLGLQWWWRRDWTPAEEVRYQPRLVSGVAGSPLGKEGWVIDAERTKAHGLGFVPIAWIKNLPRPGAVDGEPTCPAETVDLMIDADYLLSQGSRSLRYSCDPTLMIKEPAMSMDGTPRRGAGNTIEVSSEGDAKLLEISGAASAAVMEYVKGLREIALENSGGTRASADKLSAAQSGRAMELMNQALVWLVSELRKSYGDDGLLRLLSMLIRACRLHPVTLPSGVKLNAGLVGPVGAAEPQLSLRWPPYFAPTHSDRAEEAQTMHTLTGGRQLLSRATATKVLAPSYDIADPADELAAVDDDGPMPGSGTEDGVAPGVKRPGKPSEKPDPQ